MPFTTDDIVRLTGAAVRDVDDEKIGRVGQVYVDGDDRPSWATVRTGFLGATESFFPLSGAVLDGRVVRLPFAKELVEQAPRVDLDEELTAARSDELRDHYARGGGIQALDDDRAPAAGRSDDEAVVTRSEERVTAGVRVEERGRIRLRKSIVTEQQTVTVTVSHEEAVLVREPITDQADATGARELTEEEHVLVLHREVVDTEKRVVPVERVRLDTRRVTEEQDVTAEVRKEQVEIVDAAEATR